jgi:membrane protein DedA with SNARE-associated domain
MEQWYTNLFIWVQAHGLSGVFLFMLVESAGVPFPTELGFIAAQGLIVSHLRPLWLAYFWIVAGHLVGSALGYYLGRAGDNAVSRYLAHKPSVVKTREWLQKWYTRYGALTILFGRLVGQVRPWASFVAGVAGVPQGLFWLWTTIGTLVFVAITMYVTAVGWQFWQTHAAWRAPLLVGMLVVFYGLPAYKLVESLIRRYRRRRQSASNGS